MAFYQEKKVLKNDNLIDVSEGIHVNQTNGLHEFIICHYWNLLKINFRFQPEVCDGWF